MQTIKKTNIGIFVASFSPVEKSNTLMKKSGTYFKIKATDISNYYLLSEEDIKQILDNLEDELKIHFLWKISKEHRIEDVGVDYVTFEMKD